MSENYLKNLIESGEMYRRIVEFTGEGVWVVDKELKTSYINQTAASLFGCSVEEMLGKSLFDFVFEEDRDKVLQRRQTRLAKPNETHNYDFRYRCKDGGELWLNLKTQTIYDDNDEFGGVLAVVRDVSPVRQNEKAASHLAAIVESSSDAIIGKDLNGVITSWNQSAEKLFGYFEQEIVGQSVTVLIPENRLSEEIQIISRIKSNEPIRNFETVRKKKNGNEIEISLTVSPIRNSTGEIIGASKIVRDLSEEREIRKALIEAEKRASTEYLELLNRIVPLAQTLGTARKPEMIYRAVCEFVRASMPCSAFFISFFDGETNLRTAAYGWDKNGEIDISDLPPVLLTENGGPNSQAVFQGKPVVFNRYVDEMRRRPYVLINEDGNDPNSSLAVPMKIMNRVNGTLEVQAYEENAFSKEHVIAAEMVAGLAAVAVENVRLLETEAKARAEAEAANRAKDEFLSVLSHELRTPLNAMYGWVRMLRAKMLDEEKTAHAIEVIERNVALQNNLIEDLLDTSRIISGKIRIEESEIDAVKMIRAALDIAQPPAAQKRIGIEFKSVYNYLPLLGDEVRFQQILTNLLNNAVKFTPENGKIRIETEISDSLVRIKIIDSGIGIEKDFLPLIFDRFRQVDGTTRRSHSGLGLGLTIVKHLTELHNGHISVESEGKNRGTTFTLEFPLARKNIAEIENVDAPEKEIKLGSILKDKKIIMVDDNCEGLAPLQMILEMQNARVECFDSGLKALQTLGEKPFDLLVSDIGMPEIDGYDLIETLRKNQSSPNREIPAIALTAYAQSEDQRQAIASGFNSHVSKPVDFDEFLLAAQNLLVNS